MNTEMVTQSIKEIKQCKMYIPNDTSNYLFCRLQLVDESLDFMNQSNQLKLNKSFKSCFVLKNATFS